MAPAVQQHRLVGNRLPGPRPDVHAPHAVRREHANDLPDDLRAPDSSRGRRGGDPLLLLPSGPARWIHPRGRSPHFVRSLRRDAGRTADSGARRGRPRIRAGGHDETGRRPGRPPIVPRTTAAIAQSFARRGFFEDALVLFSLTSGLLRSMDRSTPKISKGSFDSGPGLDRFFRSFEFSWLTRTRLR